MGVLGVNFNIGFFSNMTATSTHSPDTNGGNKAGNGNDSSPFTNYVDLPNLSVLDKIAKILEGGTELTIADLEEKLNLGEPWGVARADGFMNAKGRVVSPGHDVLVHVFQTPDGPVAFALDSENHPLNGKGEPTHKARKVHTLPASQGIDERGVDYVQISNLYENGQPVSVRINEGGTTTVFPLNN